MQYLDKNELLEMVRKNIRPFKFAVNDFHYYIKQEIYTKISPYAFIIFLYRVLQAPMPLQMIKVTKKKSKKLQGAKSKG